MDPFQDHMFRMQEEIETFMDDIDRDPFSMSMGGGMSFRLPGPFAPIIQIPASHHSSSTSRGGRWVSESVVSSTVNGVTQTVRKRVDSDVSRVVPAQDMTSLTSCLPAFRVMNTLPVHYQTDAKSALSTGSSSIETNTRLK